MPDSQQFVRTRDINQRYIKIRDSLYAASGICKTLRVWKPIDTQAVSSRKSLSNSLSIHGNIQYDFLYRSIADTPFYQRDFRQHTVRTGFTLLYKKALPVQVSIQHRNSNSPYFRDMTDVTVHFSQKEQLRYLKDYILNQTLANLEQQFRKKLQDAEAQYKTRFSEVEELEQWLASPARLQEIIREKEKAARTRANRAQDSVAVPASLPGLAGVPENLENISGLSLPDKELIKKAMAEKAKKRVSAAGDSILKQLEEYFSKKKKKEEDSLLQLQGMENIEKKKAELEKKKKTLKEFEKKLADTKKTVTDSIRSLKQSVMQIRDMEQLKHFINEQKLKAEDLPKGWKTISVIKNLGLGRSWVDYSELTVKNISLTGVNIEANPGRLYFAAAAGRINYRYRDFVIKNNNEPKQELYLFRAGYGKKDGNNIIFTWYEGRRSMIYSFQGVPDIKPERVLGFSAESRFQINEHNYLSVEFAKSSFHTTSDVNGARSNLIKKVSSFDDRTNEAYSIRGYSYWPSTGSKLTGYYKRSGPHFQSFNLQPVNSEQESYLFRLQQYFWKKRLTVDASVRKNDFVNPFLTRSVSSSVVFKSLQLSLRIPKYPFISIGYYPATQLTMLDDQRIAENQYNTLNALMSYSYKAGSVNMTTNLLYLKYYNNTADTGFIYYNASGFSLQQVLYAGRLQLQSGYTYTGQQFQKVSTLEQSCSYQLREWLTAGGGIKYNRINNGVTKWGGNGMINMMLRKTGTLQVSYENSYLPGINRNIVPVQMGKISFYRSF